MAYSINTNLVKARAFARISYNRLGGLLVEKYELLHLLLNLVIEGQIY